MSGDQFSPSYFNSVYNSTKESNVENTTTENLNEKEELKEINSRLGFYINAVCFFYNLSINFI